jgi:hypothetical protein
MNRIKAFAVCAALILAALGAGAAELSATVVKISGKAEIQKGSDWVTLAVGQTLPIGATISTGFRSELQLKIGPSTVTVKALSRLTLRDLVQTGGSATTDLYLAVGKINAEVNKSEAITEQKFKVGSPVSTASVRGTSFSFDGVRLTVDRGVVDFSDLRGNTVQVPVGESARAVLSGASGGIATPRDVATQESTVQANSGADYGQTDATYDETYYSIDGWDYSSTLDSLYSYDWSSEFPNVHVYIGGITP